MSSFLRLLQLIQLLLRALQLLEQGAERFHDLLAHGQYGITLSHISRVEARQTLLLAVHFCAHCGARNMLLYAIDDRGEVVALEVL